MSGEIVFAGVDKEYGARVKTLALRHADLALSAGELVVILGPSGSGKTTLLNLLGGLDRPTRGTLRVDGRALEGLDDAALGAYRKDCVGFVFQFFNLVPSLTAGENVRLAAEIAGVAFSADDADRALADVGLAGLAHRFPGELSGGQQQRVAIARALAKRPTVLLCDEPTGALDQETGAAVLDLLAQTREGGRCTVVIVTHDPAIARRADRVVRLRDGVIVADERVGPTGEG